MGWAWLCLSHISMNASCVLGASVKLRVYYIFGPLWCLSLCYHKTALPLCFNPSGLSDILQIYHLLLKPFCHCVFLFFSWKGLNYSLRPKSRSTVDFRVPFTLWALLYSFHAFRLTGKHDAYKEGGTEDWARPGGPCIGRVDPRLGHLIAGSGPR